ncbi:MAG: FtsX-like permease family protein [Pseudomonadota bacterium]
MFFADIFSGFRQAKGGTILLLIQVAFTFAVVVNVYAMVDSYRQQVLADSGIVDHDTIIGVTIRRFGADDKTPDRIGEWRNRVEKDISVLRGIPGVKEVSLAHEGIPTQNTMFIENFDRLRREDQEAQESIPNTRYSADVNTLSLLGVEIVAGRGFTDDDVRWVASIPEDGGPNVVITQATADALFADSDPLGQQVVNTSGRQFTIVGVIKTIAAVYWAPFNEHAHFVAGRTYFNEGYIVRLDRGAMDGDFLAARAAIMQSIAGTIQDIDVDRDVRVETFEDMRKVNLGRFIIINAIIGGVAVLLVFVTALGNYGQVSYTIFKRTKQIGIRRALGATQGYIVRYHLIESTIISVIGILLGVVMMLGLNIVIVNGVGYGDFNSSHVVLGVLFMLAIGWISAMVPIVRATQISPAIATRTV